MAELYVKNVTDQFEEIFLLGNLPETPHNGGQSSGIAKEVPRI